MIGLREKNILEQKPGADPLWNMVWQCHTRLFPFFFLSNDYIYNISLLFITDFSFGLAVYAW